MRKRWRRCGVAVLSSVLIGGFVPGAAHAAPVSPVVNGEDVIVKIERLDEPAPSGTRATADDEPLGPAAAAAARQRYVEEQAEPPADPLRARPSASDFNVVDCQKEELAYNRGGFVIDHFRYCEATRWKVTTSVCALRVPILGCLRDKDIGGAKFRLTTAGYGWDPTRDAPGEIDPHFNQIYWVSLLDDWDDVWGVAVTTPLKLEMECDWFTNGAPCRSEPWERERTATIAEWIRDGGMFFRQLAEPFEGEGVDDLSRFGFGNRLTYGTTAVGRAEGSGYRCDQAAYVRGGRGCVFDRLDSLFTMDISSTSPHRKEAGHIYDAMFRPQKTRPDVPGKDVPGNVHAERPRPLSRAYERYESSLVNGNHAQAVRTCVDWWGPDYTQGGLFDCDEYPFKSTFQGASVANGNYSARVIDASDNRSGGAHLGNWYTAQRILHTDRFYVVLTTPAGGGGGTGGSTPDPIPDQRPSVNAGPDRFGDEGTPIVLGGAASDLESTPTVSWSFTPGPGVDPGATCTFTNAARAGSGVTCTDDGPFNVTLTASDGVNAPVSDSAVVTLRNVAPELRVRQAAAATNMAATPTVADTEAGPEPWSLYKVGDTVRVSAPIHDQGANDTHTCTIDWDNGRAPETFAAVDSRCDRSHVYQNAGMYTIKQTTTDDDNGGKSSSTMVIVYDPNAGTATGNGWVPVGSGEEAGFAFLSRYPPGGTVPDGSKTFSFRSKDLNLRSFQSLEWLVITPDGKIAFKGSGEVEPGKRVRFVAYAYRGCPPGSTTQCQPSGHQYRIVMWPEQTGPIPADNILYDNAPNGHYDVDLAAPQTLARGAITILK